MLPMPSGTAVFNPYCEGDAGRARILQEGFSQIVYGTEIFIEKPFYNTNLSITSRTLFSILYYLERLNRQIQ